MKYLCFALLLMLHSTLFAAYANNDEQEEKQSFNRPFLYITTSTGVNNNTAILGFNLEAPINDKISVDAGLGTGTWNHKFYIGGKYYFMQRRGAFALGAGVTYAIGTRNHDYYIVTIFGEETREFFNKNAQTNAFLAAYKFWDLGKKRRNRFYLQLGWSQSLNTGDKITQLTGNPISQDSKNRISSSAPGGPIVAWGFSFGIRR
ncbi:MAG: hypothetical protein H6551_03880 [Chitinophagales bacterium]|nr:hypothetical protein [Chitinophagaceae bacterium]MCB9064263.1 hypothetical protein [Chitinophagales bacterium]